MTARVLWTLWLACAGCGACGTTGESIGPALFVLPYPIGRSHTCQMSFADPRSHTGLFKYSVDFSMPIGTRVTAARAGRVVFVEQGYADDDPTSGHENVVILRHADGTLLGDFLDHYHR